MTSIEACQNDDYISLFENQSNKMYARRWGYYKVVSSCTNKDISIKIKLLKILNDKNISYQYHNYRNEDWYILSGNGYVVIDDSVQKVKAGDKITIKQNHNHCIKANEEINIIEVQYGEKTLEKDIVRIEKNWLKILKMVGNDGINKM